MKPHNPTPLETTDVVDLGFLQNRAQLLEVAAFLDRVDRACAKDKKDDFRVKALQKAVRALGDGKPNRVKRILQLLSDPSSTPIASAHGMKGAAGAWNGEEL